jgi:hypothetical protein
VTIESTLIGNFRGRTGASFTHVLRNAAVARDDFQIPDVFVVRRFGFAQTRLGQQKAAMGLQWGSRPAQLRELLRTYANWRTKEKISRSH